MKVSELIKELENFKDYNVDIEDMGNFQMLVVTSEDNMHNACLYTNYHKYVEKMLDMMEEE